MKVSVTREGNEWAIVAEEGRLYGQKIAKVEGIQLDGVRFLNGVIFGHSTAVWGAVLTQMASGDAQTVRGLGVGRPWHVFPGRKAETWKNDWVDIETDETLITCHHITLFRSGVFYR